MKPMDKRKKAVLLGGTGLIGKQLLRILLESEAYETITAIVRKPLAEHSKLRQVVLTDFAALESQAETFEGAEDVFCCLGTTIRQAGTRERFRIVDFDYPVMAARLAKAAGAQRYVFVSSMGADAGSRFFYNRVKGETEAAVRALQLPMISIIRPSLLLGEREEFRLIERMGVAISRPLTPFLRKALPKMCPIEARDVAAVMHRVAQMYTPGVHIYENDQLHKMAPGSRAGT